MKIGNHLLNFSIKHYSMIADVAGIQSTCPNSLHVLFLDFDNTTLKSVKEKVCKYRLGRVYILQSSKNHYHAISLHKFFFGRVCQIQYELHMEKYIIASVKRGYWVLRSSRKGAKDEPKYIGYVDTQQCTYQQSYAHFLWLHALHKIPKESFRRNGTGFDSNTKIFFDNYYAAKVKK